MKYKKEIIGGIILVIVAFFGGVKYDQGTKSVTAARNFSAAGFAGRAGTRGAGATTNGGAAGQIIAKDSTSITVAIPGGSGSRIVFLTASTPVMRSVTGTGADLKVGDTVVVNGTANSDGSISAQSIQIRPTPITAAPAN